ncbi:hypothetical protein [Streptomyces sp. NPDC051665]|uniref:hypothetical protein n=1 Tax=Streptomyces sp. NPDC051665 TaxID=3154647 RepID=UPI003431B8B2
MSRPGQPSPGLQAAAPRDRRQARDAGAQPHLAGQLPGFALIAHHTVPGLQLR